MSKGITISKDRKTLKYVGADCVDLDVVIPDSVESIGDRAFYDCSSLKEVKLPDSLKSIGNVAFAYCSSLKEVKLPEFLESIGDWAFYGCSSLKKITYKGVSYKIIVGDDGSPCVYEKSVKETTTHNIIRNIRVYSGVKWFNKIVDGEVILEDCGFLVCDESRNLFYHAKTKERAIKGLFEKFENIRKGNAGKPILTLQTLMTENDYISYTGACVGGIASFKYQYQERFNQECPTEFLLKDLLPLLKSIRNYDMPRLLASSDNNVVEFWNKLK